MFSMLNHSSRRPNKWNGTESPSRRSRTNNRYVSAAKVPSLSDAGVASSSALAGKDQPGPCKLRGRGNRQYYMDSSSIWRCIPRWLLLLLQTEVYRFTGFSDSPRSDPISGGFFKFLEMLRPGPEARPVPGLTG